MTHPCVVVGGTRSGVGKTVATLALIRALRTEGYEVQPAKAGPDFIDPSHHTEAADRPSRTLDPWLESHDGLLRNYHRGEGDICVVEGVMGLYDGDCSSTAAVAEALGAPVVLVVDASSGMESVAATVVGFRRYAEHADREMDVEGVIAQRAHPGRHEDGIVEALPEEIEYLGGIPPDDGLEIPSRHLGLEMGDESSLSGSALGSASEGIDTERILEVAETPPRPSDDPDTSTSAPSTSVAVATGPGFEFVYPGTTAFLRRNATVEAFSPVAGDAVPDCDAVYLPGGYPELYADEISGSRAADGLAEAAAGGTPILGECGGMMVLSETLVTEEGDRHGMAGVLPAEIGMRDRYQALDHVELRATRDSPIATEDSVLRGHEFHYSSASVAGDARFAFENARGDGVTDGLDGLVEYNTLGTYAHFHPEGGAFDGLVATGVTA